MSEETKHLSDDQRNDLRKAVERARTVAELGAREALDALGVADPTAPQHLDEAGRKLRNQLRAHARQLGDALDKRTDRQETARLIQECAYAHWHRMLFARFLAENNALMHEDGFPVTLEELDEWAEHWVLGSRWEAAARCAVKLLPQIFGSNERVLGVVLSSDRQRALEDILAGLSLPIFKARDALGWVYQFWQESEKRRLTNVEKLDVRDLPAVTQHFTEPWMVEFLLQNTLGAWWVERHGTQDLPFEMPYRVDETRSGVAAGVDVATQGPQHAKDIRVFDPCCGSGHFLVGAFDCLVRFRMREEGLLPRVAAEVVLKENIFGLELDPRCAQIAAFALCLAAWSFPGVGHWFQLPDLQIACSGLGIEASREAWLSLADRDTRLRAGLDRLYDLFREAPALGSLIEPNATRDALLEAPFKDIAPLLQKALAREAGTESDDVNEYALAAKGLASAAELLSGRYDLICTNPPFRSRNRQPDRLRAHLDQAFPNAKGDVATAFVERIGRMLAPGARIAIVLPENWMFLDSYKKFRAPLLKTRRWDVLAELGHSAFRELNSKVMRAVLFVCQNTDPDETWEFTGIDAKNAENKSEAAVTGSRQKLRQLGQLQNPDSRILFTTTGTGALLALSATAGKGSTTGDSNRFLRYFWEYPRIPAKATNWLDSPNGHPWSGRSLVLNVPLDDPDLLRTPGLMLRGQSVWGRKGIAVLKMNRLEAFWYDGEVFDDNVGAIVPMDDALLLPVAAYIESDEYRRELRTIDRKVNITAATLVKVPFDLARWKKVAAEKYPNGLPAPTSDDPTQWLFRGEIPSSTVPLQVAVARLLGYRWPDQPADAALDALADGDGIVCIPAVRNEAPAAERLLALLARAYGDRWTPNLLATLLAQEGGAGLSLEAWLRDRFFEQHCARFEQRPFIWHIWDGLKDGFSALLHYHRLDRALLDRLIHNELGDWIDRQQQGVTQKASGAEERLAAAKGLRVKLTDIAKGEAPYDLFVRWKPVEAQPIGWEPDLDDGVRQNIRPWVTAEVFRKAPKIKWDKPDRGTDPPGSPWFDAWTEKGQRRNDHHLTLKEKVEARKKAGNG